MNKLERSGRCCWNFRRNFAEECLKICPKKRKTRGHVLILFFFVGNTTPLPCWRRSHQRKTIRGEQPAEKTAVRRPAPAQAHHGLARRGRRLWGQHIRFSWRAAHETGSMLPFWTRRNFRACRHTQNCSSPRDPPR